MSPEVLSALGNLAEYLDVAALRAETYKERSTELDEDGILEFVRDLPRETSDLCREVKEAIESD